MNAQRRILVGIVLLICSIPFFLDGIMNIGGGPGNDRTLAILSLVLGSVAALLGFILVIDGRTMKWQVERKRREEVHESITASIRQPSAARDAIGRPKVRPVGAGAIPGRGDLEEPSTKACPACKKAVYKDARVCRFCGHPFGVTLRLKIYPPGDEAQRAHVVELLAEKLSMPADEVAHLISLGMRFKYDSAQKLAAARARFESLGCRTEIYEKAGRG